MRKIALLLLLSTSLVRGADLPFSRGVNLTGWLQTAGPTQIQFNRFDRQDFVDIESLGCDVVRLPIDLHAMTDGAPDYNLDPLFLGLLDQIVDWTEELEIHLILDNHSPAGDDDTDPAIGEILIPVWTRMAEHFKDRSTYLYYEILNEPHDIADATWNDIQLQVIEAIRTVDQKHTIVVGPAGWNSYNNLRFMPTYEDDNLIYTFHFYDPFLFTHQGATWTDPSMGPLSGVPFPYETDRMPSFPEELEGTWIADSFRTSYRTDGTVERVRELIDLAVAFAEERDVPLYCGELGVYIPNSDPDDRVYWYGVVREYLEEKGIAWTSWDYTGGFGLFEADGNDLFDYDLNIPLLAALGLEIPEQREFTLEPEREGFDLYLDFLGKNTFESSWVAAGKIDFFSEENPVFGSYCINWSGVDQYNHIGFDFRPIRDMSELVRRGYALDFWIRGDTPGTAFDIRFMDAAGPESLPWRMRYTIDEQLAPWDDEWHHVQIPLATFTEHGAWDGEWHEPQGDFTWTAVDRVEIVAEHQSLEGINFWLDEIRLVSGPVASAVLDLGGSLPGSLALHQNYPNPFNPNTTIRFDLAERAPVELTVHDALGQKVRTLAEGIAAAGTHAVDWDGTSDGGTRVASGIYIYHLRTPDGVRTRRMTLVR